ncbi:hypothetical protein HK102_012521, partial [Quaeritorhiza haematococci]
MKTSPRTNDVITDPSKLRIAAYFLNFALATYGAIVINYCGYGKGYVRDFFLRLPLTPLVSLSASMKKTNSSSKSASSSPSTNGALENGKENENEDGREKDGEKGKAGVDKVDGLHSVDCKAAREHLGLKKEDILAWEFDKNEMFKPKFYVARD